LLKSQGWNVRIIWACQVSESRIRRLADSIRRSVS
jgi:G:T-mismatch repair DNA endonuclease (very short patch repair protein)